MIYPQCSAEHWAAIYGIDAKPMLCMECKKILPLEVPFAYKKWRGLKPNPHEPCGETNVSTFVSVDQSFNENLAKLFKCLEYRPKKKKQGRASG